MNRSNLPYEATKEYYEQKALELTRSFHERCSIIHSGEVISLFAFGLQPILILLGTLFSDQSNIEVYQCHRDGHKWKWKSTQTAGDFSLMRPETIVDMDKVALVIDISAEIVNTRVESALSSEVPIYHIRYNEFGRNIVTHSDVQQKFIEVFRKAMEEIKNTHPSCTAVHVFPSMPVSLNVRLGMDYMPKADLPMVIYDQDSSTGGFFQTITIGNRN